MPNPITRLLDGFKLWRMQRRGDAVVDAKSFFDAMIDLADEIIQEQPSEIPRDLFIMLAYVFAAKERGQSRDHFEILRHIRERAWVGYKNAPALGALIVTELPRSEGAVRMKRYFEEIAEKRGSFLFLPAVFGVDRHQGKPLPDRLLIDGVFDELGHMKAADLVREAFAHLPNSDRARNAFLVALCIDGWGKGKLAAGRASAIPATAAAAALRALCDDPDRGARGREGRCRRSSWRNDADENGGASLEGLSVVWLQALFIAESWCVGGIVVRQRLRD